MDQARFLAQEIPYRYTLYIALLQDFGILKTNVLHLSLSVWDFSSRPSQNKEGLIAVSVQFCIQHDGVTVKPRSHHTN